MLINMWSMTLDSKLIVRADSTPMLLLPQVSIFFSGKSFLHLSGVLSIEESVTDPNSRLGFYKQRNLKSVNNTADDIEKAIEEMLNRLSGTFSYVENDEVLYRKIHDNAIQSKERMCRDVYDSVVSIDFLKKNVFLLGKIQMQKDRFVLKNLLPSPKHNPINAGSKVKVRLFYLRFWNSIRTTAEACFEDNDIDLLIIANKESERDFLEQLGYNAIFKEDYDLVSDEPDVFILSYFNDVYMHRVIGDIRKYSRLIIVISHMLMAYDGVDAFIQEIIEPSFAPYNPDYYLFDSHLYKTLKDLDYFKGKSLIEMGNAKYDGIYETFSRGRDSVILDRDWKKLSGKKKIILWAADHGMSEIYGPLYGMTFDVYIKCFLEFAEQHPDVGFIFRPHPTLIQELTYFYSLWTDEDVNSFRRYLQETPNVVFDETDSYDNAFTLADAILIELNCGIAMSALPMLKPMGMLCRDRSLAVDNGDILDYYYKIFSTDELKDFIEMIIRGEDPMYEIRAKAAKECVKHFDGKNGWRIKEFIKQAYYDKVNGTHTLNPL